MSLTLDEQAQAVVEVAKRATPEGVPLGVGALLAAAVHVDGVNGLGEVLPPLRAHINSPVPVRNEVGKVPLDEDLASILNSLAKRDRPVTVVDLLSALLISQAGVEFLRQRKVPEDLVRKAVSVVLERALQQVSGKPEEASSSQPTHTIGASTGAVGAGSSGASGASAGGGGGGGKAWRSSHQRAQALKALGSFGRMLTESPPPARGTFDSTGSLRGLMTTLSKMGRHNAIVVGHPGTGKTAIIYELARRMARQDASLPARLREMDLFELHPTFLRSGASVVGQYEERVKELITTLKANPKVILFIDEVHAMFQSAVHGRTPWSEGNEAFKGALSRGDLSCIGATTWSEYRHYIEPDGALTRRFDLIRLDPPTSARTVEILRSRLPKLLTHFAPLPVDESLCERAVALTDEYLPARYQPDKAIQLLDQACALCVTSDPPGQALTEQHLFAALEQATGHRVVRSDQLTEAGVLARLKDKIVGQDALLVDIARGFVAGLGQWKQRQKPRGVYLFGGPTGVGKTEVALTLARILGGDRDALIRIDCNTLSSVGGGGSVPWRLLGVPEGFVGYARGQGGLLSRVRDLPECIVLFDEFEKADPSVGQVLLRILDEGTCEDVDGNQLDFRRTFVIFTSNAGCEYPPDRGFGFTPSDGPASPTVDIDALHAELRRVGLGQEFIARIEHTFLFQALDAASIRTILGRQLDALARDALIHGLTLQWAEVLVDHLAGQWQPRFGVRHLAVILKNRVIEQLNLADAQGELRGVTAVELQPMQSSNLGDVRKGIGYATRRIEGDRLIIQLA